MPTGYTSGILEGKIKTFEEFAKLCTRAFGATMHLRDEPFDKEYEPSKPSEYHLESMKESNDSLIKYLSISDEEIIKNETKSLLESKEYHLKQIRKRKNDLHNLNKILFECDKFIPPTDEHIKFKEFMVDQINSTIDYDCNVDYSEKALIDTEKTLAHIDASKIRELGISEAKKDYAYHEAQYKIEVERCNKSNKWISDLFNSIKK